MSEFGVYGVGVSKDKSLTEEEKIKVNEEASKRKEDIINSANAYYNELSDQEQEEIRLGKTYVVQQNETPQIVGLSAHQKNKGLGKVREAITQNLKRHAYTHYDEVVKSSEEKDRTLDFYHAKGANANRAGYDTLTIEVGGSGFEQLRKEQSGLKGQGDDLTKPGAMNRFRRIYGERTKRFSGFFTNLFESIFHKNKGIFERSRTDTEKGSKAKKFTISGPPSVNMGGYDMQHINEYILKIGADYLKPIYKDWKSKNDPNTPPDPINIQMKGHSRGAAATSVAAKNLVEWARRVYGDTFADAIHVNFIQRDPVPGMVTSSGEYGDIDLRDHKELNATTIYSIHSEHGDAYKPQLVRGQSRIILTAEKHGVGQDEVENTQKQHNAKDKYHERAYVDTGSWRNAETNPLVKGRVRKLQAFRGSGLSDMEEGVYMRDENNALVRMRSYAEAKRVIRAVKADAKGQEARADVVDQAIKNWFIDHEYVDSSYTGEEIQDAHKRCRTLMGEMEHQTGNFPDAAEFGPAMEAIRQVNGIEDSKLISDADAVRTLHGAYDNAIEKIKTYMTHNYTSKDPDMAKALSDRMEYLSEILSQLRVEKMFIENMSGANYAGFDGDTIGTFFGEHVTI